MPSDGVGSSAFIFKERIKSSTQSGQESEALPP